MIASGIIIIILIAFVVDNSQTVRVGFVFFSADVPLIWVLVVTALLGALADRLLQWRSRKKAADGRSRAKGGRGGR